MDKTERRNVKFEHGEFINMPPPESIMTLLAKLLADQKGMTAVNIKVEKRKEAKTA